MDTFGSCDAFINVDYQNQHTETSVKKNSFSPEWNETFTFQVTRNTHADADNTPADNKASNVGSNMGHGYACSACQDEFTTTKDIYMHFATEHPDTEDLCPISLKNNKVELERMIALCHDS